MSGNVTLYDAIDSHINRLSNNLYTALPAVVESYNADKQTVNCVPALSNLTNYGQELPYPALRDVQVMFPSGGGGILSFPVKKGDNVLLVFSKNSLDLWKSGTGKKVKLDSGRSHSISDAIAIVGLATASNNLSPNQEDVELKFNGNSIVLKADGSVEINSKSSVKIQNDNVELIDLLSRTLDEVLAITTNTMLGPSPINNILQFQTLKAELDTLKG